MAAVYSLQVCLWLLLAFAFDKCRTYSQEREQFGVPIGSFQRVQDVIIDMDITLEQGLTWLIDLTNRYDDRYLG